MVPALIIEERTLLREGLVSLLEGTPYRLIAALAGMNQIEREHLEQASVIIIGVSAGMDRAIAAIRRLRPLLPDAKLFMVADDSTDCDSQELLRNGADGCILDVTSREVLVKALDLALLQQRLIVIGSSDRSNHRPAVSSGDEKSTRNNGYIGGSIKLSEREREILACLARGASNKAIARHCRIAETTVKAHLKAILRKIAVHNRTQAAIWAKDHGLTTTDTAAE
jgi:two-component system nitrate/nitrite response regulator NarL